jgi:hypothetical protein
MYEVHAHLHPPPERVGVECVDLDGDGSIEIVSDEKGTPLPTPTPFGSVDATGWFYTAYRFDGERLTELLDDHGSGSLRPPPALQFPQGFDCDGVKYGSS